jgi:hypothetical protein
MKRIFLPALIFCWAQMSAQNDFRFADSTAQWNVLYTSLGVSLPSYSAQTRIFVVKGDTSNQYQIIGRVNSPNNYRLRKDSSGKVYVIPPNNSTEHLLYDFGTNVGDTISVYHSFFPDVKCIIDSIDTIVLGKVRKRIKLQCGELHFGGFYYPDIWIEGIGSVLNEFLSPGVSPGIVDGPNAELLCFFENDTLFFHNQNYADCFLDSFWVGIVSSEK